MKKVILALIFFVGVLLATYKLSVSPPTWEDEGIIIQVADNVSRYGVYGVQTAPENFVSAGFVTTGPTVILPVALSLKIFGEGLLSARYVMVAYLIALLVLSYFLINEVAGENIAIWSLALLASFGPIYGTGKDVLGEIPGTVFLIAAVLVTCLIEKDSRVNWPICFWAGLFFGLSMISKPIFLIIIPFALVCSYIFTKNNLKLSFANWASFIIGVVFPIIFWLHLQFGLGDSLGNMLNIYSGNPGSVPLLGLIKNNLYNSVTHIEPLYFLFMMSIWAVVVALRKKNGELKFSELTVFTFGFILAAAYMKTLGYYRYFLPAETIALIYLPVNIFYINSNFPESLKKRFNFNNLVAVILFFIVILQLYKTALDSWVSKYYSVSQTSELSSLVNDLSTDKKIFFCNVSEALTFFKGKDYYQYVEFADNIKRGVRPEDVIKNISPDFVLEDGLCPIATGALAQSYKLSKTAGKYNLYMKR